MNAFKTTKNKGGHVKMFLGLDSQAPQKTAAIDCLNQSVTYGEIVSFFNERGVDLKPRTIAFLLCKNTVGSLVSYILCVENGVVPVTLASKIDKELLDNLLSTYTPFYIIAPSDQEITIGTKIFDLYDYSFYVTGNSSYPIHDDLQLLMPTSGSTGSPKLVRYKKGNLESNAKNVAIAFGWTESERSICDLSMNYTMGLNIINSHLSVGATCLMTTYNLTSADFWKFIKEQHGTNYCGVPFSYDLLKRLRFERMDLPDLATITEGGGKLTDQRFKELAEYANNTNRRFIASFGTTETSARMAVLPPELALKKTGSIGYAIPEGELFLLDENGNQIEVTVAEGELCYKGPNVTMGYAVKKEDLNNGDEFCGVYRTGDLARRDEDGCYYITGRLSRFLKLLSYRVSLDQCEQLIQQKFGIECACTGSDQEMYIYLTDESKKVDVIEFISLKTGLFRNLFKVIVVPEILRNENGKIQYRLMEEIN